VSVCGSSMMIEMSSISEPRQVVELSSYMYCLESIYIGMAFLAKVNGSKQDVCFLSSNEKVFEVVLIANIMHVMYIKRMFHFPSRDSAAVDNKSGLLKND